MGRRAVLVVVVGLILAGSCRGGGDGRADTAARRFTLAVTGDVLIHPLVAAAAASASGYDFGPLLAGPSGVLAEADLALCHLETPLAPIGTAPAFEPRFAVPGELAAALAGAGYDACSTASNHSRDAGPAGVRTTLELLERAGIAHAGTARDAAEAARPVVVDAGGVKVGLASYSFGFNVAPEGPPWLANLLSEAAVVAGARSLKAAGAEFVVVSLHWGTEYDPRPDALQRSLAPRLLASPDIDLVVGHHAHVVQPVERFGEKFAVYGLGNLLAGQADRCCPSPQDGVVIVAEAQETPAGFGVTGLSIAPTLVEPGTYRVRLVSEALTGADGLRRRSLTESWCATATSLGALGVALTPLGDRSPRCSS